MYYASRVESLTLKCIKIKCTVWSKKVENY